MSIRKKPDESMQKTEPKGIDPKTGKPYEPVEIPVPTRDAVLRNLAKAAERDERCHDSE